MARLLLEWLNDEVRLSGVVQSLDDDFRDGYMLGELLMRYNQQDDFDLFDTKDTPECKIRNFCLLEPTLRRLGVTFNFKLAYDIMDGKFGTMKALLSELRAVLDRIKKNSQPPIATKGQNGQIMRVMNPGKANYDAGMSVSFEKSMRLMMENPTEALIKKAVTNRFIALGNELREQSDQAFTDAANTQQSEKQRQKEIFRHRKKHEGEFAKAWELINIEQWKKNQTRAINRKELAAKMIENQTLRIDRQRTFAMESARESTFRSIDDFDSRIAKEVFREDPEVAATLGASLKKTIAGTPGTGLPELSYVDKANLQAGLVSTLKKIKEQHEDGVMKQQSHDRRRRKFVREREFSQSNSLQYSAESEIVGQLLNQSASEKVEFHAQERILSQKQVIVTNRSNRMEIIRAVDEQNLARGQSWSREAATREKAFVIAPRIQSQVQRIQTLDTAKAAAERQRSTELAQDVLTRILDLSDWVISCRQLGLHHVAVPEPTGNESCENDSQDGKCVPAPIWNDAVVMFTSSLELAQLLPLPTPINVFEDLPMKLCETPECMEQDFLLKAPFQTHHVMVPASFVPQLVVAVAESDSPIEKTTCNTSEDPPSTQPALPMIVLPTGAPMEHERIISEYLAASETSGLFSSMSSVLIPGFETVPENVSKDSFIEGVLTTPDWILTTPPQFLLGEAIVVARCKHEPLPEDGTPLVELPKLLFRGTISGISELARKSISKKLLETMPDIKVIKVEDLVHEYAANSKSCKEIEAEVRDETQKLSVLLASYIHNGIAVPNSIYVSLLVQAISRLPEGSGFVIEDFPNTRLQASMLLEALSGINYDSKKPSRGDRASSIALPNPAEPEVYDSSKCGIDRFIFVDAGQVSDLSEDRVRTRTELRTGTSVKITDDTEAVGCLQDLYTPLRPVQSFSVDLYTSNAESDALRSFIQGLGKSTVVRVADFGSLEEASESVVNEIFKTFGPAQLAGTTQLEDMGIAASDADLASAEEGQGESAVEETKPASDVVEPAPVVSVPEITPVDFPVQLAAALSKMWATNEAQLSMSARSYFCSLRDLRYQMLQRRRGVFDAIYHIMIRADGRQDLVDGFCAGFNDVQADFRFDADCIAELHLRAVELGDVISCLSDKRKKEAEDQLQQFLNDGLLQVSIHRTQCEGAALLQAMFNSFSTSLQLLFDTTKSISKFDKSSAICNRLEEALPVSIGEAAKSAAGKDAKGGTKDAKGGKGGKDAPAAAVPFREPVPPIVLPSELMNSIPTAKVEINEPVDPKAKGKPADKVSGNEWCPLSLANSSQTNNNTHHNTNTGQKR